MQQKSARPERTASRMLGRTPRRPDSTRCSASLPSAHGGPPRAPRLAATTTRPRGTITHEERGLQDLWNRKLPLIAEGDAWAPNRDTGQIPLGTPFKVGVDRDRDVLGVDIEGTRRGSRRWESSRVEKTMIARRCFGPTTPRSIRPKRAARPSSALQSNSPDGSVPCVSQKRSPPKELGRLDTVRTFSGRHPGLGCGVAAALPNQQVHMWLVVARNFLGKTTLPPKVFVISISSVAHAKRFLGPQWATAID